jgi:hypothetical protein
MYPGAPFNPLILFPAFFAAVTPGLMAANLALRLIPPVKSALDQNAHGVPGASYRNAMHDLGKASAFLVPIGLALALIAAAQPWAYAQ